MHRQDGFTRSTYDISGGRMKPEELKVGMKVKWKGKLYKIISLQNGIKLRRLSKTFGIIYGAMGIKAEDLEEIK